MKNHNPIIIVLSYLHRFSKLSGIAFAIALMMNALVIAQPLQPVDLGTAENYVILAKTAVSVVPTTSIVGNIGISPNTATSITGLALIMNTGYATSSQVTGRIYAAAMTAPTPSILTVAIGDMETAYTDAAGRTTPDFTELHTGNLSGQTLVPGLYKWGTGVLATSNFTISGGPDDVWIFQIAQNLTLQSNVDIILAGGAKASNIFWQVAGEVNIGTNSHFEGVILSQTAIHLFTGASINGRMLAQSAVTMDQNAVTQPVIAAEPSLALTTIVGNPTFLIANGISTSTITVTVLDAAGDPIGTGGDNIVLSATTGLLGIVTDNNDGTYTATYTSPTSTAGTPAVVSGTLNGDTILDTAFIALNAGPASGANSTLVANPNTLPANGTSTSIVTATIRDANGNLTSGGANVVLSTNLGTLSSVTDNSNGTYTAVFTASVTTGIATISGTVNGQNLPTATVTMGAGVASTATTTIDASPTSIVANGTSTSTITVRLRDAEGNLLTTGGATIVLATTRGTLGFVIDNNNGTYTATFTSPTSTSGSPAVISGTLNGSAILDTASITLTAGVASGANSTLTASPNTIPANGTSTSTVTVTLRDVNGNVVVSGGNVVLLNTSLGSLGGVINNGNGTYTAILTSSLTTGTATINGTVNGQNLPSATVVMGAGVASTATSTIEASPTTLIANGISTSAITVILRDALGNLITTGSSTVTLAASVGTLGVVTNNGNGTYTATYSSPIFTAGSPAIISGTLNGNLIDDTAQIALVAGPVFGATSTMTASPNTLPANGTSTSTVTVTLRDVNGNLITGGGATVLLATNLGTLGSVSYNINGTYTATFTAPLTTGTATITGTANGQTLPAATILIGSGFASSATTTITANPTILVANGVTTSTITVTLRDANDNLITTGSATVTLAASTGTLGSVTNNNNGTYTAIYTSPISISGSPAVISGMLNGNAIVDTAEIMLVHGPALGSKSTLVAIPNALLADGVSTSVVTATIRDANGNLTSGGDNVLLSTNFGTLGPVTDNGNGRYTAIFTAPHSAGVATISGTVNLQNLPTAKIVMGLGVASTATTTIDANPTSLIANGLSTSVITVVLRDAAGNLLGSGGPEVQLFATVGTIGFVDDNGDGTYTAIYISPNSVSGSPAIISGTLDGSPIIDTAQIMLTEYPASGAKSTLTANPVVLPANGIAISIVTATIRDVLGNLTNGGDTVVLTTNLGSLGTVKDNGNGTYTAVFTASNTIGLATITGTVNGQILPSATIRMFDEALIASPLTSTITAYPIILPADGSSQSEVIVTLRNSAGQLLGVGGHDVTITTSVGTLSTVQDLGNGTYRAYLTSVMIGKAHIMFIVNTSAMNDVAFVTFYESDVTNPVTQFFNLSGNVFHDANGSELWDFHSELVVPGVLVTLSGFDIKGNPFTRQTDTAPDGVYMITNIPIGRYEVMASFADNTTQAHPSQIGVFSASAPQFIEMLQSGDIGISKAMFTSKSDGSQGWASRTAVGSDNVFASAVFDLDNNGDGKADGSISVSGMISYTRQSITLISANNGSSRINANVTSVSLYGKDNKGQRVNIYLNGALQPMTIDQSNSSTEASVNWSSLLTIVINGKQYTSEVPVNFTGFTSQIPLSYISLTAMNATFTGSVGDLDVMGSRILTSFGPDFGYYFANYGSAPASYGTLIRDNGARHLMTVPGPSFGATVTASSDGSPSASAQGGDGIVIDGAALIGKPLQITLSVQNAGFVNAWIDYNRDGEFNSNELVINNEYFEKGTFVKQTDVPISSNTGNTFARFRISSNPFMSATGLVMDGEVEDYALSIESIGNAISGRVYEDLNGNKVYDNHDISISGVMLFFDLNNNGIRDLNEPFTTSNGDGMYMMWSDNPGLITVRIDNSTIEFTGSSVSVDLPVDSHVSGVDFIKGINTSDDDDATTPVEFSLSQNYPNPFNPSTLITYSIAEPGEVLLSVYDVTGRKVATLVSQHMNAGTHTVTLNASKMASGVYMYRIQSGTFTKTMKMTLIK
jgi:uncharacterized Zn ribbon protein